MDLFIFRHGETYQTKNNIKSYGDNVYSAEILPEGKSVIKRLAEHLKDIKTDINLSSPFKRCRQTVEIVEKVTSKKFEYDNRLSEYVPENEMTFNFVRRIEEFYKDIEDKYSSVTICTHGYPISAVVQMATKGKILEKDLDNYPRPGVLTVIKNGQVETLDFNS